MKVTNHDKAQVAIIGTAMSAFREGKGIVLVLGRVVVILLVHVGFLSMAQDCFTNAPVLSVTNGYANVQAAYDAAGPGCSIIRIEGGIYREAPITLAKHLRLESSGGPASIIRPLSVLGIPTAYF